MTILKTVTIAAVLLTGGIWRWLLRRLWSTRHGRNDHCYRDARRPRLHSATSGGLRVLQLRTRLLGRLRAWWVLGRLRVRVALKLSFVCFKGVRV
jgi:hypothetical protein